MKKNLVVKGMPLGLKYECVSFSAPRNSHISGHLFFTARTKNIEKIREILKNPIACLEIEHCNQCQIRLENLNFTAESHQHSIYKVASDYYYGAQFICYK